MIGFKTKPKGAPVGELPADTCVTKFELPIDGYILRVEEWLGGWKWGVWTKTGEMDVDFNGRCKTVGRAIQLGIEAIAKARQLGSEPF